MAQAARIPVIDISSSDQDEAQVARDLVEAAIEHGFIYIRNTGKDIPLEAVDGAFALVLSKAIRTIPHLMSMQSRKLFAAPLSEKEACTIQQNNRGVSESHGNTNMRCSLT